jgi:hypothetical protein
VIRPVLYPFSHPFVFLRWEAGQLLSRKLMLSLVADFQQQKPLALNPSFVGGIRSILCNTTLDKVLFYFNWKVLYGELFCSTFLKVFDLCSGIRIKGPYLTW